MDLIRMTMQNPFRVLGASAEDTRETLIEKQREMALWGENARGEQALSALLYPQSRLEAELRWFPCTAGEEIGKLLDGLSRPHGWQPVQLFHTDAFLARFNALRLQLLAFPIRNVRELAALIHSLCAVADALLPAQVMEEINRDRAKSGFSQLRNPNELDALLTVLLRETVRAFLAACPPAVKPSELGALGTQLQKDMKDRDSVYHNSYLLDLAAEEIPLWNSSHGAQPQKASGR